MKVYCVWLAGALRPSAGDGPYCTVASLLQLVTHDTAIASGVFR